MYKNELISGKIYECANNKGIRRLDKITKDFLYYSIIVGFKYKKCCWTKLAKKARSVVEDNFINGRIIDESYIVDLYGNK